MLLNPELKPAKPEFLATPEIQIRAQALASTLCSLSADSQKTLQLIQSATKGTGQIPFVSNPGFNLAARLLFPINKHKAC
jgi:hypothetical protein